MDASWRVPALETAQQAVGHGNPWKSLGFNSGRGDVENTASLAPGLPSPRTSELLESSNPTAPIQDVPEGTGSSWTRVMDPFSGEQSWEGRVSHRTTQAQQNQSTPAPPQQESKCGDPQTQLDLPPPHL